MKIVLITSPCFPPVNAAEHQRVRTALPSLHDNDWHPAILCVDPNFVELLEDSYLLQTTATDGLIKVVADKSYQCRLLHKFYNTTTKTDWQQFKPCIAREMATQFAGIFDEALVNHIYRIAS